MTSISLQTLQQITTELNHQLKHALVTQIKELYNSSFILTLQTQIQSVWLFLSAEKNNGRIHIIRRLNLFYYPVKQNTYFVNLMQEQYKDSHLREISLLNKDRVIQLKFSSKSNKEHYRFLILEFIPKSENCILLDSNRSILHYLNQPKLSQRIQTNTVYTPPKRNEVQMESPNNIQPLNLTQIEQSYEEEYRKNYISVIQKFFQKLKSKKEKKYLKDQQTLQQQKQFTQVQQEAELLKTQIHQIKPRLEIIELVNYYSDDLHLVRIKLDPKKSAQDNITAMFQKAKKQKLGIVHTQKQIQDAEHEIQYLSHQQEELQTLNSHSSIRAWMKDWNPILTKHWQNYVSQNQNLTTPIKNASKRKLKLTYHSFISETKHHILVGKDKHGNHEITFQIAKGYEFWLHVENYPSAHAIIRMKPNEILHKETLMDAAHLVIHFSGQRNQSQVSVMYTLRKYLQSCKGKIAEVIIKKSKNMIVDVEPERLMRLLSKAKLVDSQKKACSST